MQLRSLMLLFALLLAACEPQPEPTPQEHKDLISSITRRLCMTAQVSCELQWRGPRRRERVGVIPIETPEGPKITIQHVRSVLSPSVWKETPGERDGEYIFSRGPYMLWYLGKSIRIEWLGPPVPPPGKA